MAETKREKFVRLAEGRVNKVLDLLDSISKLANRGNYDYSEEDVRLMFKAISDRLNDTKGAFADVKRDSNRFSLDRKED